MKEQKTAKTILLILYWALFSAIWLFLFWRCQYGFADADEAFYLTIPYRLCLGDKLFLHEWHLSQTSSLLLYPIMRIYTMFFPDLDGVVLHFRWIFTAIWGFAAIFFEKRLRVFSDLGAKLAAIVFFIFTSNGIIALNYNTLGILLFSASCIICITSGQHKIIQLFFSGVLFAGAVLCCPYLLLPYVLLSITVCFKRFKRSNTSAFRSWMFFSSGAFFSFLVFCIYLLTKASPADYIRVFPLLFQDPEHESISVFRKLLTLVSWAVQSSKLFLPCTVLALIVTVTAVISKYYRTGFACICLISGVLLISYFKGSRSLLNQLVFPVSILGLYCVAVTDDPVIRKLFQGLWIPGFLYGLCINLSSNQYFFAFSSVSLIMTMGSIIIACRYIRIELYCDSGVIRREHIGPLIIPFFLLMVVQIGSELQFRYEKVYWDGSGISGQTAYLATGPDKGIYVNKAKGQSYLESEREVQSICYDPDIRKVLFLASDPGLYLLAEKEFATYSAWIYDVDQLSVYYQFFPEKIPDAIYIRGDFFLQYIPEFEEMGFIAEQINGDLESATLYREGTVQASDAEGA